MKYFILRGWEMIDTIEIDNKEARTVINALVDKGLINSNVNIGYNNVGDVYVAGYDGISVCEVRENHCSFEMFILEEYTEDKAKDYLIKNIFRSVPVDMPDSIRAAIDNIWEKGNLAPCYGVYNLCKAFNGEHKELIREELKSLLHNGNKFSIKTFKLITGIDMPTSHKVRKAVIDSLDEINIVDVPVKKERKKPVKKDKIINYLEKVCKIAIKNRSAGFVDIANVGNFIFTGHVLIKSYEDVPKYDYKKNTMTVTQVEKIIDNDYNYTRKLTAKDLKGMLKNAGVTKETDVFFAIDDNINLVNAKYLLGMLETLEADTIQYGNNYFIKITGEKGEGYIFHINRKAATKDEIIIRNRNF